MKYGVREICDVVLRAKSTIKIGNSTFTKDMPVLYFDSLKTSSLEGASTAVYATGGRGNTRLIAWEGEKTVTFTMEDALISPVGLAVLSGAGLIEGVIDGQRTDGASKVDAAIAHATETTEVVGNNFIGLHHIPILSSDEKNGNKFYTYVIPLDSHGDIKGVPVRTTISSVSEKPQHTDLPVEADISASKLTVKNGDLVMVDYYYYTASAAQMTEIQIDAQNFAGNYYLEASTLWRNKDGVDKAAEFIIPNCKIQTNFTFSMASSGDPSTFTFTLDAFPDYTKYDATKKVLCAIRIIEEDGLTKSDEITTVEMTVNNETDPDDITKISGAAGAMATSYSSWKSNKTSTTTD